VQGSASLKVDEERKTKIINKTTKEKEKKKRKKEKRKSRPQQYLIG
jgi:hypothetical protein